MRLVRRRSVLSALVLTVSCSLLAACGDDDDDEAGREPAATTAGAETTAATGESGPSETSPSTEPATSAPSEDAESEFDPDAVLRVGADFASAIGGQTTVLDPVKSSSLGHFEWLHLIYDTLLYQNADGSFEPRLAESYEIVDPQTVTVTLKEGLVFQDGTPLDGEAVKFTLERNLAAQNPNFNPALNDLQTVTVDGLTLTISLAQPVAGSFVEVLAGRESMPVSPTAAAKGPDELSQRPVGAGPYRLDSVTHDQLISLRKHEDHWEAENWKLAGIDFVQVAAGPTQVTALRSEATDVAPILPTDMASLGGEFEIGTVSSDSNFRYVATCKSQAPFDNLDFRKAFAYAIDREQIVELAQAGQGEPMWMMWPKGTRYYTESLEGSYAHDVEQAKAHLAAAGYPDGIDLELIFTATGDALPEVLQAQLADAGIRVTLVPTTDIVTDFYTNVATPGAVSAWIRPGLQKVTRSFGPNSVANVCQYDSPELNALTAQIAALDPDSPETEDLWDQVNQFVVDNVLWEFVTWQPLSFAWNERVQGVEINPTVQSLDFRTMSMTSA